jgi:hypothetical protein
MAAEYHTWRPHPWHGLAPGPNPPMELTAFIEITPFDLVKFEVDKNTGYLRVDRSQTTSSLPPALYGSGTERVSGMDGGPDGGSRPPHRREEARSREGARAVRAHEGSATERGGGGLPPVPTLAGGGGEGL